MKYTERYTELGCANLIKELSDGDFDMIFRHEMEVVPILKEVNKGKTIRDRITVGEAEEICAKAGALLA